MLSFSHFSPINASPILGCFSFLIFSLQKCFQFQLFIVVLAMNLYLICHRLCNYILDEDNHWNCCYSGYYRYLSVCVCVCVLVCVSVSVCVCVCLSSLLERGKKSAWIRLQSVLLALWRTLCAVDQSTSPPTCRQQIRRNDKWKAVLFFPYFPVAERDGEAQKSYWNI